MTVNSVINTRGNITYNPKFLNAISDNNAFLLSRSGAYYDHNKYLYATWGEIFNDHMGITKRDFEDIFIGIENSLVLSDKLLNTFVLAFEKSGLDIMFYSDLAGLFNLTDRINDAFFIMKADILKHKASFIYYIDRCPLCEFFKFLKQKGYTMGYYCHGRLEIARPVIFPV